MSLEERSSFLGGSRRKGVMVWGELYRNDADWCKSIFVVDIDNSPSLRIPSRVKEGKPLRRDRDVLINERNENLLRSCGNY